jgi:hypothetical protein
MVEGAGGGDGAGGSDTMTPEGVGGAGGEGGAMGDPDEMEMPALHPDDAVAFEDHWYRFTQAEIDWPEAEAICESTGGYLTCIETQAEDAFLLTLAGTARPWMGLNNEADVNTWVWVNGSPVDYTNWMPGQPDYPDTERWGKITADGTWDDGNIPTSFICEWDS